MRKERAMQKRTGLIVMLILAVSLSWSEGQSEMTVVNESADADITAIESLWEEYCCSREECDAAARLALHDPDAIKMPQESDMFLMSTRADTMQQKWERADAVSTTSMHIEPLETVILGDYAYSMGVYMKTVQPNNGKPAKHFNGKLLTILRKNEQGEWVIFRDSYSSCGDQPCTLTKYALFVRRN
jgi:ketosteroid isomerase-like protein